MQFFSRALLSGLSALALCLSAAPAMAGSYLTGSVGATDVLDDDNAAQFGLEYRFSPVEYGIVPMIGANVDTDGAVYGYGGINWEVPLIKRQLYLIPNFAVGVYDKNDGKNLGGPLEFRSGIELNYQFSNEHRIGVGFNHLSNASIYDRNPGMENLYLNYSVPIGDLFGR